MNYEEALSWIHSIARFGMNQGLERIVRLMNDLGDPHKKLNFLHIGGTNGKGSTAAFAASVLEAAGYRVGLYTSPYLEQFTNRMSINGLDIPKERLVELTARIRPLVDKIAADPAYGQPTEFEVVTAIAFTYFAEESPDLVVLEVGLGGRLDATNVISPSVTAITTISLEHTQVLGDTVEKIAGEKAGIIKEGSTVVTQAAGGALSVFEDVCSRKNVPLYRLGREFKIEKLSGDLNGQTFHYGGIFRSFLNLRIPLLGDYQVNNAALALASMELLEKRGFVLPEEAVRAGLAKTKWPGRLEIMHRSPLVVIDGAHNSEAFQSLCNALQNTFSYRRLILVLGILADKAIDNILEQILPLADALVITMPSSPRAADPNVLKTMAGKMMSGPVFVKENIPEAVNLAISMARSPDLVLIAGSLYVISDARLFLKSSSSPLTVG
ncbi:MAG: folylpolyglutamate synthase/dihydrofolate synthase family protein [Bacillota bacterium]|nr:folylpolyglutamate synthase/dihydrofolate synthase family protein [Bacillota bacterium]